MRKILRNTVLLLITITLIHCGEDDPKESLIPVLRTTSITNITEISAKTGGTITADHGKEITARGVCWSTTPDPTIADNKTTNGAGLGAFNSILSDLSGNTLYYVRAYATNEAGTGYGSSISFTTDPTIPPTVTTTTAGLLTKTSVQSGGVIASTGGGIITARGVCWSTDENPTIADNKTTNGTDNGIFTSEIMGLSLNTTYYVRAYATNEAGTSYGQQSSITMPNEFSGVYEIVSGSILRNSATGPDPIFGGTYNAGLEMVLEVIDHNTVSIRLIYREGTVIGSLDAELTIDKSATLPDGSYATTISSPINATLRNTPGEENKFFPGSPGDPSWHNLQELTLNFDWGLNPNTRVVSDLRLRYVREPNQISP